MTELKEIENTPINFSVFTLHTQSFERDLQEVAKASEEVLGKVWREGWDRASRLLLPIESLCPFSKKVYEIVMLPITSLLHWRDF